MSRRSGRGKRGKEAEEMPSNNGKEEAEDESPRRQRRQKVEEPDLEDDGEDDGMSFSQVDMRIEYSDLSQGVSEVQRTKADAISGQERKKLVNDLTRYIIFKGGRGQPIRFDQLQKDVFGEYKNVARAILADAQKILNKIFGMDLLQDGDGKLYFLVLKFGNDNRDTAFLKTFQKTHKSSERGLLMTILALAWMGEEHALKELSLYQKLHKLDSRMPNHPPSKGGRGKNSATPAHPVLGDVKEIIDRHVAQKWLLRVKAPDNIQAGHDEVVYVISIGPRSMKEIGLKQIVQFACDAMEMPMIPPATLRQISEMEAKHAE